MRFIRDMGKPPLESYTSEIGMLISEIRFVEKHLKRWNKPQSVKTMLFHMPARSRIIREPYGVVCIIGPWNYPFQLLLSPLAGAISGGNCAIIKPSEMCIESSSLISNLVRKYFDPKYITVVTGDAEISAELVNQPF